jgi:hypothetical protein
MKYYAAVVNEQEIEASCLQPPKNILASYHYFKKKGELIKACLDKGYDVLIDSGAFSAENSKKAIDIDEYCKYLIDNKVATYAGLDVIGNAKGTMANIKYMEDKYNLRPIPTFHLGGDMDDLRAILHYPYIALGGMVFSSGLERYLNEVWGIILKESPKIRVHGFGCTNIELMESYPWYSVDSSSFKGCKRFGRQQILWNGFEFITMKEDEYIEHLKKLGYDVDNMDNKQKCFLYDYYSVQSYKLYGEHLKAVNKIKDFSYLTAQHKMF